MKRPLLLFLWPVARVAVVLATVWGCAERRDLPMKVAPPARITYEQVIKGIFDANCVSCHGVGNPTAGYDLSTYDGVQGNGFDGVPNAIPGDGQSLLVTKSLPGGSMNSFYASPEDVALVERWVVEDSLAIR